MLIADTTITTTLIADTTITTTLMADTRRSIGQ
jgi:hypothetical protein